MSKAVVLDKLTLDDGGGYTLQQSQLIFNQAPNNVSWYNFDARPAFAGLAGQGNFYYQAEFRLDSIGNEYTSVNANVDEAKLVKNIEDSYLSKLFGSVETRIFSSLKAEILKSMQPSLTGLTQQISDVQTILTSSIQGLASGVSTNTQSLDNITGDVVQNANLIKANAQEVTFVEKFL